MRLLDIKRHINIAYENFDPQLSSSGGNYYFNNVQSVKKAIQALCEAGFLPENIKMSVSDILDCQTDRLILDNGRYSAYTRDLNRLKVTINILNEWINQYIPTEETETIVNIKLPPINTLADFASSANWIKKALSQLIPEVGGNINVKQLDHGSYWLIIDVGTLEAVALVGALAGAAYQIAIKTFNILKTIEELKSIRLDNQLKELQIDEKKYIKTKAQEEAKRINQEQFGKTKDEDPANFNEREGRICVSIEELVKIIRAGGEIHQSLEAPKTVSELYPKYNTSLSFTPIALLSNQESNDVKKDDTNKNQFSNRADNE